MEMEYSSLELYDSGAYDRQIHFGRKAMLLDKTHHARPGGIKPKEQIKVNPHVVEWIFFVVNR